MKLHSDSTPSGPRITAYGDGFVTVDDSRFAGDIVVSREGVTEDSWPGSGADIRAEAVVDLADRLGVEIVLIGTGATQVFPPGEVYRACAARGIGIEVMDTPAACRTYNILASEGRLVAALLLEIRA